ncbi:MAG: hypothetical protein LC114_17790, partial [Bryobacterales bacterium]|nr:hypothetical protein [Bryobacterales bacterium]
ASLSEKVECLQRAAESYIRTHYVDYHGRVEQKRLDEIGILVEDLERFDRGAMEQFREKQRQLDSGQQALFDDPNIKGLRTRLENQIKAHQHSMNLRRQELDRMRLGAFPAPTLLNMVVVTPA